MFIDALGTFDPAGTLLTVTAVSTNVYDAAGTGLPASPQQRDLGTDGEVIDIYSVIGTTFTAAGAATLQVSIQSARDVANAPGTFYDQMMTGPLAVANLVAGREICRTPLPLWNACAADGLNYPLPRFYRLNYTVATGPMTAGALFSAMTLHNARPNHGNYASGFVVQN